MMNATYLCLICGAANKGGSVNCSACGQLLARERLGTDQRHLQRFAHLDNAPLPSVKRRLTRRRILIGLSGLVTAGAIGGTGAGIWWWSKTSLPSPSYTYQGHSSFVEALAWSPDGKRIVSASSDGAVHVWGATDGGNILIYQGQAGEVLAVTWSPDGKHIASASSDGAGVPVWDATTGQDVFIYRGHRALVYAVSWSPDGKHIASASSDQTVQIWNAVDGTPVLTRQGFVQTVAWSPDGKYIASEREIWNAISGSNVFMYRGNVTDAVDMVWSPDGKRIASVYADDTVHVWDTTTGNKIFTYQGPPVWEDFLGERRGSPSVATWSPDGKSIASNGGGSIQVWSASNGDTILTYHSGSYTVAWSPDGKHLASSRDSIVEVWDAPGGRLWTRESESDSARIS